MNFPFRRGLTTATSYVFDMRSENKRVGSFNLTEEGYQALATLQKKTGHSRKDVVSGALIEALGPTLDRKVIEFQLPDPAEVMMFRTDIVALETAAKDIVDALYGIRPKDKTSAKSLADVIAQLYDHIADLKLLDGEFRKKLKLLKGLSSEDFDQYGYLVNWLNSAKSWAQGRAEEKKKLRLYELIEKLARLAAPEGLMEAKRKFFAPKPSKTFKVV